jgi:glycosyltransferase involved in cell wall biosynthesis
VIVRTRDSEAGLPRCLASLAAQTVQPELIVVDSGSTDRTLEIARAFDAKIREISSEAFSYGHALNVGAGAASAPVHFALSSHCVAPREWVERSLRHYERPEVAATSGQTSRPDRSALTEPMSLSRETLVPDPIWGFSNHASSWRAEVWRELPFDETLIASEDLEWSDRVVASGRVIVFDPALVISTEHRKQQGVRALYERVRRETEAIAAFRAYTPPTLSETVGAWWSEIPPGASPLRQRLSPWRLATLAARYSAGRGARGSGTSAR